MKLREILSGITEIKAKGSVDIDIKKITSNSKEVKSDSLFIAIKGFETDGHKYIENAIENGATAIMIQEGYDYRKIMANDNITLIMVPDTRIAQAICATNFYEHPEENLKLIGVTGTKGKTTTSFMIKEILEKQGKKLD